MPVVWLDSFGENWNHRNIGLILVIEVYASVIGNIGLPMRLAAWLGAIAAVSTASAGTIQLNAAGLAFGEGTARKISASPGLKSEPDRAALKKSMKSTASAFMENGGQWDKEALYLSQTPNLNLWVTEDGLRTEYYANLVKDGQNVRDGQVIDMSFIGGKAIAHKGSNALPTVTQFVQPDGTKTVKVYQTVKLDSVYKGIDLKLYTENGRPRYDLVVAPGANPDLIKMNFRGSDSVKVDDSGKLLIGTKNGSFEHRGLFAYQIKNGRKIQVPAKFRVEGSNVVSFELGSFDRSSQLIIDPIVYGTYYGGDTGIDEVRAVAADADAGIYFTGSTQAPDFPILFGPFSVNISGASDTFLVKLRGDAYVHEYAAYIGGSGRETGKFISIDPTGNTVWIAGTTTSGNFPAVGTQFQGALAGATDTFLIAFNKDVASVLVPAYSTYYGSAAGTEVLTGFAIAPVSGDLVLSGHANAALPGTGAPTSASSHFVARFGVTTTPSISLSQIGGFFYGGSGAQTSGAPRGTVPSLNGGRTGVNTDDTSFLTGSSVAVDSTDNVLITGTVASLSIQDTATAGAPIFPTTAGAFNRILRFDDAYIAKFDPTGNVIYAGLLGGSGNDQSGGIAVDESGNAYLTGIARSADFPRTNGTLGQIFTSAANVFVSKVTTDGSQLVYSTNLRTAGNVIPLGIGINQRGFAFVTGIVDASVTFPDPPGTPGDPNVPTASATGTIQTTTDAIRTANTFPGPGDLPATDGFLNIIDSTAETLLYGTYIGGNLDDVAFAPFVDRIGDVWVMGYSDSGRFYFRSNAAMTGGTAFNVSNGGLVAGFITGLAFKSVIENAFGPGGTPFNAVPYGSRYTPFTNTQAINNVTRVRDGYLFRFRLDVPLVTNLVLAPSSVAGGLGSTSTGTITISGPAPAEGVDVVVTLSSTVAASLSAGSAVAQQTVSIPAGATTGTFTIHTSPVIDPTQVAVKAEYLGSFQIRQLTVNPWLNQLTLNPTTVASGNQSTGRVTLFSPATQQVDVTITTDNPGLISFPGGQTVTIPVGQQSANFVIQTSTVDTQQQGNVSASFLGKTRTQVLAVKPAVLDSLSFVPNRVAGGGTSTGTVTLDGNAPSTGATITLTAITNAGFISSMTPNPVVIPAGQRSATFTVVTTLVPSNTFSVVRATYASGNKDATLLIDNISLTSFTLNPTAVAGGASTTGTVVLNQPAPPGGAFVTLTTTSANVILPTDEDLVTPDVQVLVAANNTARSFQIGTRASILGEVAPISASRGGVPITRNLTINPVTFTMTITPNSVLGGNGATLRVTLAGPAPAGGVPFTFTKVSQPGGSDNSSAITINGTNTGTVPAGATFADFAVTTTTVAQTDTVVITANTNPVNGNTATVNFTVRAPRVVGITFTPTVVRGMVQTTLMQITLDGPAPAGGANVSLSRTPNPQILNLPSTINVPAGQSTFSQVLTTNKVSRTLSTVVTATYGGNSANATLSVTR